MKDASIRQVIGRAGSQRKREHRLGSADGE